MPSRGEPRSETWCKTVSTECPVMCSEVKAIAAASYIRDMYQIQASSLDFFPVVS